MTDDAHAGERPSAWAVLYDADCGFCKWLLSGLLRWDRAARLHPIALQRSEADDLLRELTPAERMASWHLISPTGERRSGGAAVPPLLQLLPAGRLPAAGFARFSRLTDRGYRRVAEHRSQLSKWVPSSAKQRATERVHQREQEREKRNVERFPADFMFQLTKDEAAALRSQTATSGTGRGGRRYAPYVFTEQGVAMLFGVLRSKRAVAVNIAIMRAFVELRRAATSNAAIEQRLGELERQTRTKFGQHDQQLGQIFQVLRQLISPPPRPKRQVGLRLPEDHE